MIALAAWIANLRGPRAAIADADEEQIRLRVVRDGIPYRAAPAPFPPFAAPRPGGHFHLRVLERLVRIARHGVPAPHHPAGLCVIRRDVSARTELGAALPDEHEALHDTRRAGDRIGLGAVDGIHLPHRLSGGRIDGDQAPIERADIDFAVPGRHTAIHDIAARVDGPL